MKALLSLALLALVASAAHAQTDYPNRPPRMIVPFPPGGSVDIVTRIVAAKWGELLGQPVVVENRAGAGGNVGADYAARAAPSSKRAIRAPLPRAMARPRPSRCRSR